jgi:hypothetical protein
MVLRAKGPQDVELISEPEVTFWKATFPRHTNFACEDIDVLQSAGQNSYGQDISYTLTRSGDLVASMMLRINIDKVNVNGASADIVDAAGNVIWDHSAGKFKMPMFTEDLGRALIRRASLQIGGYDIEEVTGDWLHIQDRTSRTIGRSGIDAYPAAHGGARGDSALGCTGNGDMVCYVPLTFSFSASAGLALPLISLQYHDTRVRVSLRELAAVSRFTASGSSITGIKDATAASMSGVTITGGDLNATLVTRYVFLDDQERKSFALESHNYLITELQHQEIGVKDGEMLSSPLYLNHPVKEILIYVVPDENRDPTSSKCVTEFWNWTQDNLGHPERPEAVTSLNLSINQQKMFGDGQRDAVYFGTVLVQQYHTRCPTGLDRVYIMPFSLDPESWRPTGSINMSRIDQVNLTASFAGKRGALKSGTMHVLARSFNSLRVKSGMGGRRYAS